MEHTGTSQEKKTAVNKFQFKFNYQFSVKYLTFIFPFFLRFT